MGSLLYGDAGLELLAPERRLVPPQMYDGENLVRTIAISLFIRSSPVLQITRTAITFQVGSNFDQIWRFSNESSALNVVKSDSLVLVGTSSI